MGESEFEIFTRVSGNMLECGMVRCSEQRCLVQDKRNKNRFGACDVIHDQRTWFDRIELQQYNLQFYSKSAEHLDQSRPML